MNEDSEKTRDYEHNEAFRDKYESKAQITKTVLLMVRILMLLFTFKYRKGARFFIYTDMLLICIDSLIPYNFGDVAKSRIMTNYLILSFINFSCDMLPSLITINVANTFIHLISYPKVYDTGFTLKVMKEYLVETAVINFGCMVICLGLQNYINYMKENALLLEQRNQFLGGLKEGFIALSEDMQSILYSNTASQRMLLTKTTDT